MGLQVANCLAEVKHTLRRVTSAEIAPLSIVNEAGAQLVNMHPWKWLERFTSSLDYVQSQTYVTLPVDFGDVLALYATSTSVAQFELVTFERLLDMRSIGTTVTTGVTYGALAYPDFTVGAEPANCRLEVFPTPSANEVGALSMFYRANWVDASPDTDYLDVLPWMVPLYKQVLRAYARGVEEEDVASMSARLAEIVAGPIFQAAIRRDGRIQSRYGALMGGAIMQARGSAYGGPPLASSITGP